MDLSVGICTYQRHEPLRQTLGSLCQCEPISADWELLVVDNACDAEVEALVRSFAGQLPVRYLQERKLGTSHARNRCVQEASAPILLFTDDDVTFDAGWLSRMWQAVRSQPTCAFWGGRVEPVWTTPQPKWFDPQRCAMLRDSIVQYQRGHEPRAWNPASDPPFYTANLALRVEAMRQVGGFDTAVGHRGGRRMGMEDSLMVKAVARQGGSGWYAADAVVYHPVPSERVTRPYARGFAWRQGWLSADLHRAGPRPPRWFFRAAASQLTRGLGGWISGSVSMNPAAAFAGQFEMVFGASKLWHALRGASSMEHVDG